MRMGQREQLLLPVEHVFRSTNYYSSYYTERETRKMKVLHQHQHHTLQ